MRSNEAELFYISGYYGLFVTIMLNPFVTGTLTVDIGRIHYAGIE
jgi:hypothetical protein